MDGSWGCIEEEEIGEGETWDSERVTVKPLFGDNVGESGINSDGRVRNSYV